MVELHLQVTGINITLTNNSKNTLIKLSSFPKIKIKRDLFEKQYIKNNK